MPVPGALPRSVQHVTVGTVLEMRKRAERTAELDLHEKELQYQLPIDGLATRIPAFTTVAIDFEDWEFHYAPAQRDSELRWPHHGYGAYIPRGGPVGIFAHVVSWVERPENGAVIGAAVMLGAVSDSETPLAFGGWVHCTFQALALSRDDLSDTADLEEGTE